MQSDRIYFHTSMDGIHVRRLVHGRHKGEANFVRAGNVAVLAFAGV